MLYRGLEPRFSDSKSDVLTTAPIELAVSADTSTP